MKTTMRQVAIGYGCRYFQQVIDTEGRKHDLRNAYLTPEKHHQIITTEDGYKLALNPHNNIAYKILGEKYE